MEENQDAGGDLVYSQDDCWLICLQDEKRLLPASVVKDKVAELANKYQRSNGVPPGRKQLKELKEQALEMLIPKAFLKRSKTFVWIDLAGGFIGIDASSRSSADHVIECLRVCLDEFPLAPINTKQSPMSCMTELLLGNESTGKFTVDRECELRNEEKASVAYKKHLLSDEAAEQIRGHLSEGKFPIKLAMTWSDRISFVLTDRLEIKRLQFIVPEESKDSAQDAEDAYAQRESDFALMSGEFSRFLPDVIDLLGGEGES